MFTFRYHAEKSEFDHGVCCIVRADTDHFRETQITCKKVELLSADGEVGFEHEPHEELVSEVVEISGEIDEKVSNLYINLVLVRIVNIYNGHRLQLQSVTICHYVLRYMTSHSFVYIRNSIRCMW